MMRRKQLNQFSSYVFRIAFPASLFSEPTKALLEGDLVSQKAPQALAEGNIVSNRRALGALETNLGRPLRKPGQDYLVCTLVGVKLPNNVKKSI